MIGERRTTMHLLLDPVAIVLTQRELRSSDGKWPVPPRSIPLIFPNARASQKHKVAKSQSSASHRRRSYWFCLQMNNEPVICRNATLQKDLLKSRDLTLKLCIDVCRSKEFPPLFAMRQARRDEMRQSHISL